MTFNYLVTGANGGLGKDACRQLALREDTSRVYLACRSSDKANQAMEDLVSKGGCAKEKLVAIHFDASEAKSEIEKIAQVLEGEKIHGLILNAGGPVDEKSPQPSEPNGVLTIVQINLVGHIQLVQILHTSSVLAEGCRILFSSSESARAIPSWKQPSPKMGNTAEFYTDFMKTGSGLDPNVFYGTTKGIGNLYFAEYAKAHPQYKVLSVSPGGTLGTNILNNVPLPWLATILMKGIWTVMYYMGRFQTLEQGAKKYVDAVTGECDEHPSGTYLACAIDRDFAGPLCDQKDQQGGEQYVDAKKQKAAYEALQAFL